MLMMILVMMMKLLLMMVVTIVMMLLKVVMVMMLMLLMLMVMMVVMVMMMMVKMLMMMMVMMMVMDDIHLTAGPRSESYEIAFWVKKSYPSNLLTSLYRNHVLRSKSQGFYIILFWGDKFCIQCFFYPTELALIVFAVTVKEVDLQLGQRGNYLKMLAA